jgi:glycerol uptake facilitator-like aquaporin
MKQLKSLAGRLPKNRLLPYALAQVAGALAAGLILRVLLQSTVLGINSTQMPGLGAVLLEALCTAWLTWSILGLTEKDTPLLATALGIGATLTALGLWAGPLCGGSFNPARSLGPALAAFDFSDLWIYLLGPMLGGAAGAKGYAWFKKL